MADEEEPTREEPDRERRLGFLIGFLVAVVLALGVLAAVLLTRDDNGRSAATTPTASTTATTTPPATTATQPTTPPTTTTATPTTPTTPAVPTISQGQAKAAASAAASRLASQAGIHIPASQFDARCTGAGGGSQAATWTCDVASSGGQCSGPVTVYAAQPGVAATRNPRVACGE